MNAIRQTFSPNVPRMTVEDWRAEAERRFGPNPDDWAFKCPICGHVQRPGDFRQYKDRGATPDSACKECIGRYAPGPIYRGFGDNKTNAPKEPCDYAIYGLFVLPGVLVVHSDGHEQPVFAFAEAPC